MIGNLLATAQVEVWSSEALTFSDARVRPWLSGVCACDISFKTLMHRYRLDAWCVYQNTIH